MGTKNYYTSLLKQLEPHYKEVNNILAKSLKKNIINNTIGQVDQKALDAAANKLIETNKYLYLMGRKEVFNKIAKAEGKKQILFDKGKKYSLAEANELLMKNLKLTDANIFRNQEDSKMRKQTVDNKIDSKYSTIIKKAYDNINDSLIKKQAEYPDYDSFKRDVKNNVKMIVAPALSNSTNETTFFNAGQQIEQNRLSPYIQYLRFIAIDDGKTTELCKSLNGTVKTIEEWRDSGLVPPLHHNCRSVLETITVTEAEKGKIKPSNTNLNAFKSEIAKGFDNNPTDNILKTFK